MLDSNTQKDILSTLENILLSLELIKNRFSNIKTSDDFLDDEKGLEHLDSISMRLIAIGEGFKNIDSEIIYDICDTKLEQLFKITNQIHIVITNQLNAK